MVKYYYTPHYVPQMVFLIVTVQIVFSINTAVTILKISIL